jgi:hypothetical protein
MNLGRVSSAALMLSGLAGLVTPRKIAAALDLSTSSGRGVAETRAGLGGTYAALGAWALTSRHPSAHAAVGVIWLGAAAARIAALAVDDPHPNGAGPTSPPSWVSAPPRLCRQSALRARLRKEQLDLEDAVVFY